MGNVTSIRELGNQLLVSLDDGTSLMAFPTPGGLWIVAAPPVVIPPDPEPTGGLIDWWTASYGQGSFGDWESHASYSRGGTDWSLPYGTVLKAPAAGTIVNYTNSDAAGLKTILILDVAVARKLPASNTLMNGVYREDPTAPARAFVAQHLSAQGYEGHVNQGQPFCVSGNSAGPGSTGDTHLHAQLLAGTTIDDRRLDFMKFV